MPDSNLQTLTQGKTEGSVIVPVSRVKDAASLNVIVGDLIKKDEQAALARIPVQEMLDGKAPYNDAYMRDSGQEGRCNLNFGDGKKRIKLEAAGYYDLTESVPTLALVFTEYGGVEAAAAQTNYNTILAEEWHREMKDWQDFDSNHQLLIQKSVSHGVGFLYFQDDLDWRYAVAGLDDFKVPRSVGLSEGQCDVAAVLRTVSVGTLYSWIAKVDASDKRWNLMEVRKALMEANGTQYSPSSWEQYEQTVKNNDLYANATAQDSVKLVTAWVKEFSGKVSQYLTLRNGTNLDYLFKCESRFDTVNQCFTFFPYEVGSNGTLHSVRGLAHEIYPQVQVLNNLRCQTVDNAKLSGSLILQPATATDAEDMAILFYAGAAYIPPNLQIQNAQLANPATNILPVLDSMAMGINGDTNTSSPRASQQEKTKFEVHNDIVRESVLPTASMALFYQPWGRHLSEVWRRFSRKGVKKSDPGGEQILAFRKRCEARGVPPDLWNAPSRVCPYRALGYGSPSSRLAALDELMQYYGSLDPVGQNNLLRDRFAQKVTYGQVDRYVPKIDAGGRLPIDAEIAELQNAAMSAGNPVSVLPNDQHIIHLQSHFPNIQQDLDAMESGKGSPEILQGIRVKIAHIQQHMQTLKPDILNKATVAELSRVYNNTVERVQAALEHAQVEQEKTQQGAQPTAKEAQMLREHDLKMQQKQEDHQLELQLRQQSAQQELSIADAESAANIANKAKETAARFLSLRT